MKEDEIKKLTLLEKLFEFQNREIEIKKNKEAYGYNYAPLEDIIPIIKPILKELRIGILHTTGYDSQANQNFLRTTLYNVDAADDEIVSTINIDDEVKLAKMNKYMVIGSATTYFRRYHLLCMLGLLADEDSDANGAKPNNKKSGSKSIQGAKEEDQGPDFVKIFTNLIAKGKSEAIVRKSLTNYEKQMKNDVHEIVTKLIDETFNKKK